MSCTRIALETHIIHMSMRVKFYWLASKTVHAKHDKLMFTSREQIKCVFYATESIYRIRIYNVE
jgi:hypothetical protein